MESSDKPFEQKLMDTKFKGWLSGDAESVIIDGNATSVELREIADLMDSEKAAPAPEAIPPAGTIVAGSAPKKEEELFPDGSPVFLFGENGTCCTCGRLPEDHADMRHEFRPGAATPPETLEILVLRAIEAEVESWARPPKYLQARSDNGAIERMDRIDALLKAFHGKTPKPEIKITVISNDEASDINSQIEEINAGLLKAAGISAFEMGAHAFNSHLGKQENPFFPSSAAAESWDRGWENSEETQAEEKSFIEEEEAEQENGNDESPGFFGAYSEEVK